MQPGDLNRLFIATSHQHFRRTHTRFAEYGLGEGQPRILWQLSREDGISQAELARRCNLESPTITVALCRMEKSGFVQRANDEQDLRVTRVQLTKAGRRMHQTIESLHLEIEEECLAGFTAEEKESLRAMLERMRLNMKQAEETGRAEGDKNCLG